MSHHHYVYSLEDIETKEFYFGSRSCKCKPEKDNYMGSPVVWKPNKNNLKKTILRKNFKSRKEATRCESVFIRKFVKHPLNRNYHIPKGSGFKVGISRTQKTKDKISKALLGRDFKLSKEHLEKMREGASSKYQHIPTGKIFKSGKEAARWADLSYSCFLKRVQKDRDCNEFKRLGPIKGNPNASGNGGGHKAPNRKHSDEVIKEVKILLDRGELSTYKISDKTGVSRWTIRDIQKGISYKDVKI